MSEAIVPKQLPNETLKGVSDYRADFAKYLVHHDVLREIGQVDWNKLSNEFVLHGERTTDSLPKKNISTEPLARTADLTVAIVGGGISGLYTAWICQHLGISWHIYEANPERLGGRLYTYWFDESSAGEDPVRHDYYDIGAMRYPYTPVMDRTFRVLEATKTKKGDYLITDRLGNQPTRYNDITQLPCHNPELEPGRPHWDPFSVSKTNNGPIPDDTVRDPDLILNDAYGRFRDKIKRAVETPRLDGESFDDWKIRKEAASARAWEFLLKHDRFSLRDYLTFVEGETFETTHWLETLNAGTGWFDEAFTENVLESLAFDYYNPGREADQTKVKVNGAHAESDPSATSDTNAERGKWYYLQNGSSSLVINVLRKLEGMITGNTPSSKEFPEAKPSDFPNVMQRISCGRRVTKISRDVSKSEKPIILVHVDSHDNSNEFVSENFDTVFNSTTFCALQRMDLIGLDLPYDTKAAIRSLRYDASTKVAIRFKKQWWTDKDIIPVSIEGGLGKTDMPLRTCVYPSYNIGEAPAVLLCSYTWGADSERIASMVNQTRLKERRDHTDPNDPRTLKATDQLAQVMLDNLARLHTTNEKDYQKLLAYISSEEVFDTYHAHDWSKDTYTCGGAFALFSPRQFSRVYPSVVRPLADGRFHIIGEASSANHAWVVGALDSAVRAMYLMLGRFKLHDEQKAMVEEFGDIGEVDKETDHVQIALGMLPAKDRACATPASRGRL